MRDAEGAYNADGDTKDTEEWFSKPSEPDSPEPRLPDPPKPPTFNLDLFFFKWQFNSDSFKVEAGIPLIGYASLGVDQSGGNNTGLHLAATTFIGGAYLDIGRNDGTHGGISMSVDTIFGGADIDVGTPNGTSADFHVPYLFGAHLGTDWAGGYSAFGGGGFDFVRGRSFDTGPVSRMFGVYSGGSYQSGSVDGSPSNPFLTNRWRQPRNDADRGAMIHDVTFWRQKNLLSPGQEQQDFERLRNRNLHDNAWRWQNIFSIDPYNSAQSMGQGLLFGIWN